MTRAPSSARRAEFAAAAYAAGTFVAAALGAPWLYRLAQLAARHAPMLAPLAAHPLHRYLQRLVLAVAVAALPGLLRALGLRRWADVGLASPRAHLRAAARGALAGGGIALAAALVAVAAGGRVLAADVTPGRVAARVLTALVVAPFVAFLEELLFRGVLDGGLRRAGAGRAALAAGSAFYAAVHFLARPATPDPAAWDAGFRALGGMLAGLGDAGALVPAFLVLWLVGAYLGELRQRSRTLLAGVGVHAGAIFVIQLYGLLTAAAPGADAKLWGSGRLVDGWATLAVFAGAIGVARVARAVCERRVGVDAAPEPAPA